MMKLAIVLGIAVPLICLVDVILIPDHPHELSIVAMMWLTLGVIVGHLAKRIESQP